MSFPASLMLLAVMLFAGHSHNASLNSQSPEQAVGEMANANPITSHILDTTKGRPAAEVRTILYKFHQNSGSWLQINEQYTNKDGRVGNLISSEEFTAGIYKFFFDTKPYFDAMSVETFYPFVEIVFEIKDPQQHYHVPLLLNPFGYSTYRGS